MKSRKEDLTNLNILEELNRKVQIEKKDEKEEFYEVTNLNILEKLNRNTEIEKDKKK